jgi:hypothetical protein
MWELIIQNGWRLDGAIGPGVALVATMARQSMLMLRN